MDWLGVLASAFVAYYLAILGGMHLYWQQANANDEKEAAELRQLLIAELSDMRRVLTGDGKMSLTIGSTNLPVLITVLRPVVCEKVATSGMLHIVVCENLLHLARKCHVYNVKCEHLLRAVTSVTTTEVLMHAATNLIETTNGITDNIDHIAQQLQIDFSNDYPERRSQSEQQVVSTHSS